MDWKNLVFENKFARHFPGDESGNPVSRMTPKVFYAKAQPTPVKNPKVVLVSSDLEKKFGRLSLLSNPDWADFLSGNKLHPQSIPYAARYGGHQFGHWADQLGDGRAITLGELKDMQGQSWEIQLKGSGPTPYSRRADGRAVLRSSLREFIASEALHHMGIATTRALALLTTGENVTRDLLYSGNPKDEPGAIVVRMAPSFLRFGNFEILAASGETENLKKLVQWTAERFYPETVGPSGNADLKQLFCRIGERTQEMILGWMRVGFVHGVMNTDNMSVLGLTIDYGPYGFLDSYEPDWTPNTTDLPGRRYSFKNQPAVAAWNLARLAEAFLILEPELVANFQSELDRWQSSYEENYQKMMLTKLGLKKESKGSTEIVPQLESLLTDLQFDYTRFFSALTSTPLKELELGGESLLMKTSYVQSPSVEHLERFRFFLKNYIESAFKVPLDERSRLMRETNPRFVPRNFILYKIIESAETGSLDPARKLVESLSSVYNYASDPIYDELRPVWALDQPGSSTLSCSS